jgi:hypothetical protein
MFDFDFSLSNWKRRLSEGRDRGFEHRVQPKR